MNYVSNNDSKSSLTDEEFELIVLLVTAVVFREEFPPFGSGVSKYDNSSIGSTTFSGNNYSNENKFPSINQSL